MCRFLLLSVLWFIVSTNVVSAHVPSVVEQSSIRDIKTIEDPELSQALYGALEGFPHTYEIRSDKPFHLYVQVLVPDIEGVENTVSGIIIKETGNRGRVVEVSRMLAKDASWSSFFEPWGADSYRTGGVFEKDVDAGVYRIEMSTPENFEKYVLVVGKREEFFAVGYFELLKRIGDVKVFYGKSRIRAVESPLVYVPIVLIITLAFGVRYFLRRKRK